MQNYLIKSIYRLFVVVVRKKFTNNIIEMAILVKVQNMA